MMKPNRQNSKQRITLCYYSNSIILPKVN